MNLKMLKAQNGDCFIISFDTPDQKKYNIIIDGGQAGSYKKGLKHEINEIFKRDEFIDLIILTHIDDDHIGGLIKIFEDTNVDKSRIKEVLYNSSRVLSRYFKTRNCSERELDVGISSAEHSYQQGFKLEMLIDQFCRCNIAPITYLTEKLPIGDARLTFISPTISELEKLNNYWERETYDDDKLSSGSLNDYQESVENLQNSYTIVKNTTTNDSSISFIFELYDKKILFLSDSNPNIIIKSLNILGFAKNNKLKLDYVKLSHHGSRYNTNYELLEIIECSNYLISTSGTRHGHPDKETLAKILKTQNEVKFYCNYDFTDYIFRSDEIEKYDITLICKCKFYI